MSLNLRWFLAWRPFNKSKTRWKIMRSHEGEKRLSSEYFHTLWKVGEWHEGKKHRDAPNQSRIYDHAVHVYVDRPASSSWWPDSPYVVVEMEVEGFVASGKFAGENAETWRRARIVKVFTQCYDGTTDVTHRFVAKKYNVPNT